MNLPRPVVLCADDFGLSDGVSRGIAELAEMGRISALGVMSNMPGWRCNASLLTPLKGRIGIGLHLNFTTGKPLGAMPSLAPKGSFPMLRELLTGALRGKHSQSELRAEIERQITAFEHEHGSSPDFVDGHQHVHVLPGIRKALLETLRARGLAGKLWLRDPSDRPFAIAARRESASKALMVRGLAMGFRKTAKDFDLNEGFSGYSPLKDETDAKHVFEQAFSHLGSRPLVMCHPGYVDDELRQLDPCTGSRVRELDYLRSDGFKDLLASRHIVLVPRP